MIELMTVTIVGPDGQFVHEEAQACQVRADGSLLVEVFGEADFVVYDKDKWAVCGLQVDGDWIACYTNISDLA